MKLIFENNNDFLDLSKSHKIENEDELIKFIYHHFYQNKIILKEQELKENEEETRENFIFNYDFSLVKDQKKFRHNVFALELANYLKELFPYSRNLFILKNYNFVDKEELNNLFLNLYQIIGSFLYENQNNELMHYAIAFNKWIFDETLENISSYLFELDLTKERLTRERIRQILAYRIVPFIDQLFYLFGLGQINYPILLDSSKTNSVHFFNFISFLYNNKDFSLIKTKSLILIDKSSKNIINETSTSLEHIYDYYTFFNLNIKDQLKFIKNNKSVFSIENKIFFREDPSMRSTIRFFIKVLPSIQFDQNNLNELKNFYSLFNKSDEFHQLFLNPANTKIKKPRIHSYINENDFTVDEYYFLPISDEVVVNKKFIVNFDDLKTTIFKELLLLKDEGFSKIGYYEIQNIVNYMPLIQLNLIDGIKQYSMSIKFFYFLVKREFSDIFNFNNKTGYWIYFEDITNDLQTETLERLNNFLNNFDDLLINLNELLEKTNVSFNTLLTNKRYDPYIIIIGRNSGINLNFLGKIFEELPENKVFIEHIENELLEFPTKSCFIETITNQVFSFLNKYLNRPLSSLEKWEKSALIKGYLQKFSPKIFIKNRLVSTIDSNITNIDEMLNNFLEGRKSLDIVKFKNEFVDLYKLEDTNLQFLYTYFDRLILNKSGIMLNQNIISFDNQDIKKIEEINEKINDELKNENKQLFILNEETFFNYNIYTIVNALMFNKKYKVIYIKNYPLIGFRQFKQKMFVIVLTGNFYKEIKDYREQENINYINVINYIEDKQEYIKEFGILSNYLIKEGDV